MNEQQSASARTLMVGDFYQGAFGPTILLALRAPDGPAWLRDLFMGLARNQGTRELTSEPAVRLKKIGALELRLDSRVGPLITLTRSATDKQQTRFAWVASASGWMWSAGMLEPFLNGQPGHQYLTRQGIDDALVEVSFGEPEIQARLFPND